MCDGVWRVGVVIRTAISLTVAMHHTLSAWHIRCTFEQGNACALREDIGTFGCVLGANLVCRLPDPVAFLDRLASVVAVGGVLVLTTPWTWLEEYTPRDKCKQSTDAQRVHAWTLI